MKKQQNYIFLDGIFADYANYYGRAWESKLVEEFKKYLIDLSKNTQIFIITQQDISKIKVWLLKYGFDEFIDDISNGAL